MPKREKFILGAVYHVLNRGANKNRIFFEGADYVRFIHDLFEFNNENDIDNNMAYHLNKMNVAGSDFSRGTHGIEEKKPRKLLLDFLAFSLMPNHYHFLVRPRSENAIPLFMKRLNMGYSRFIREKYGKSGTLFEGRYKAIRVEKDAHFNHLPFYIHLNPLDLKMPEWRKRQIRNVDEAMKFLESYRWSSHLDYIGKKNFPSVTQREFLLEIFGGESGYEKELKSWLHDLDSMDAEDMERGFC